MRKFGWLLPPAMLVLLTFFLLHIPAVVGGVQSGMATAALSVLPALFFFAVTADLTVSLTGGDLRPLSPKASVFLLGALCGFPVGAIVCERMCASGALDRRDAERLLPFVNNASPAFLLGAVGNLFGDRRLTVSVTACRRGNPLPAAAHKEAKRYSKYRAAVPRRCVFRRGGPRGAEHAARNGADLSVFRPACRSARLYLKQCRLCGACRAAGDRERCGAQCGAA